MAADSPFPPGSLLVAYLRDSGGVGQEESVPQQERALQSWCQERSLVITTTYKDIAQSGTRQVGRTGFHRLIDHFRRPEVPETGILIWNWNRFARNVQDAQYYRADLRRRGVLFHSLNDTIPDGPEGIIFEAIIDWKNQRYSEEMSADIKRALYDNMIRYKCLPGTPPVGYQRKPITIGTRRDGSPRTASQWVPDPETIATVQQAFQLRAAGHSLSEILQGTRLFSDIRGYSSMFRNAIYIGQREIDGQLYQLTEPIIDPDTWAAVQEINRKYSKLNGPHHPRRRRSNFLLSGLVRCRACQHLLNGHTTSANGRKYHYYLCTYCKKHAPPPIHIPQATLEEAVLDQLIHWILQPNNLAVLDREQQQAADRAQARYEQQARQHQKQLARLQKKIDNLVAAIAERGHSTALLKQLAALEEQQQDLRAHPPQRPATQPYQPTTEAHLAKLRQQLQVTRDRPTLRTLLQGLIHQVILERHDRKHYTGAITYFIPLQNHPTQPPTHTHKFTIGPFL